MVHTRSSSQENAANNVENATNNPVERLTDDPDDLNALLDPFRKNIKEMTEILDKLEEKYEARFKRQQTTIDNLRTCHNNLLTRVVQLERKAEFKRNLAKLNERKLDDNEQVSKKINLRLVGMEIEKDETPATLMTKIQQEVTSKGLDIPSQCYDRCHREGERYKLNGKTVQTVLLKMCWWRERDLIYRNRKNFSFKVYPHITYRRKQILEYANSQLVDNDDSDGDPSFKLVDFVFIDRNCKLCLRTKKGRFHHFSSNFEFVQLVMWLAKNGAYEALDNAFAKFYDETNDVPPPSDSDADSMGFGGLD